MASRSKVISFTDSSVKLQKNYSDAVYKVFLEERYGIAPCGKGKSMEQLETEKMLCDWKVLKGAEDLSDTQLRYFANLPIYIDQNAGTVSNDSHYRFAGSASNRSATVTYNTGFNGEQNIVEINAGGAVTRINLNSVINIDNTELDKYTHYQETPSTVWTVVHNMEFVPGNELITDLDGNEIEGVTRVIDLNTIEITFSEAVAGYAYVS